MTTAQTMWDKAQHHLRKAEEWQGKAEAFEAEAAAKAAGQQQGRMARADNTTIDLNFMAKRLLDTPGYTRACGIRDAHQKQAQMYIAAHIAGIPPTYPLDLNTGQILTIPVPRIPQQRST